MLPPLKVILEVAKFGTPREKRQINVFINMYSNRPLRPIWASAYAMRCKDTIYFFTLQYFIKKNLQDRYKIEYKQMKRGLGRRG